ncbi:SNF2 family domain-containing protein [Colletotrichum sp. SAR 10_98]|nr:SNF2 family domain-containing protein [Colletotrichum sp. SAR 10_98]
MATPPRDEDPEKADKFNKGKFFFACDDGSDEEEMQGLLALKKATHDDNQHEDIIDQTIRETLEKSQTPSPDENHRARTSLQSHDEEYSELFVSPNEDIHVNESLPSHPIDVKPEPDSDDDLMIIDPKDATADARDKWSILRDPWVVDLTNVKQEQGNESSDIQNTKKSATRFTSLSQLPSQKVKVETEALEKRKAELRSKAIEGSLSRDEFDELMEITAQLNAGVEKPPVAGAKTAGRKKKPRAKNSGNQQVDDAAKYWAEFEEKEKEKKKRLQEKNRKRKVQNAKNTNSKRSKGSAKPTVPQEDEETSESDDSDSEETRAVKLQIAKMLRGEDFIQERAARGDKVPDLNINATRKVDQLKQMKEAAADYQDPELIKRQAKELTLSTKAWGPRRVRANAGDWDIKQALTTPLHNHQIVIGAWMMGRELRETRGLPRGGILADGMGMGKTIETLSIIAGNRPSELLKDKGQGATLVVCPSQQMVGHWMSEVKKHCLKRFSREMVRYKKKDKMDLDLLGSMNIVLTTYRQVGASVPSIKERDEMQKELGGDPEKYEAWLEEKKGDLHRIKWYRVVLDESHSIKNHLTHGALACFELKSKYRWVVSGTLLINSATEFFPYLKFIRCDGVKLFNDYVREYHGSPRADRKLHRLIHQVMYRRTPNDWFLGQPILNLPATHPTHQYLMLSEEENVIFRMLERCFRQEINGDLVEGNAEKHVKSYLAMLLRLRQAATHPFLLEGMMADYFSLKDLRITKERLAKVKGKKTMYTQIGSWTKRHQISNERMRQVIAEAQRIQQLETEGFSRKNMLDDADTEDDSEDDSESEDPSGEANADQNAADNGEEVEEDVDSVDEIEEDADGMVPEEYLNPGPSTGNGINTANTHPEVPPLRPFGHSNFGLNFDMDPQLDYLKRLKELEFAKCMVCNSEPPEAPIKGQSKICPGCRNVIGQTKVMDAFHSGDTDDEDDAAHGDKKASSKEYTFGFDCNNFQHYEEDKKGKKPTRFLQLSDKNPDAPVTPSAKMTALKETVLRWQAEAPDDKIIIFSQFHLVMKIAGRILEAEGIKYSYLSGRQNIDQREKAVKDFQERKDIKVMIISLRAGGQCLNLTEANRVILMELWWNHAVEQQAFSRVFRIGQDKETHFVRFIVDTPIEKRMLRMQVGKILKIDAALQDDSVRAPKIRLADIASLLGKVVKKNGVIERIAPDYSDGENDDDDDEDDGKAPEQEEEEDLEGFVVKDGQVEFEDENAEDGVIHIDSDSDSDDDME